MADKSTTELLDILQNNVVGVFWSMQAQIKAMSNNPDGPGGRIVNFTSVYGEHGCKFGSAYGMSKHAVIGMTKAAALEYAKPQGGIQINAVSPGVIMTEMTAALDPSKMPDGEVKDFAMGLINNYPQSRFGEVDDVSRGVRYLLQSPWAIQLARAPT